MDAMTKVPPQNLEAERAVLGSMLMEKDAIVKVIGLLSEKDFYTGAHQKIFSVMLDLYGENKPVDVLILSEALEKDKVLDTVGGGGYLTTLINSVATSAHVEAYAQIVKQKSLLRELIRTCTGIIEESFREIDDSEMILDRASQQVLNIARNREGREFVHIKEVSADVMANIEKIFTEGKSQFGVRTGFSKFDECTLGLNRANLIILAGRPGTGKTSFALNIATNVATREKLPVLIYSLEMSKEELMLRMLCSEAGIDSHRLKSGRYPSGKVFIPMTNVISRLSDAPIYISNCDSLNVMDLRARSRRFLDEKGSIGLIVIDYLQLMTGRSGKVEFRQQDVSEISRGLKLACRDLNVPILALSQLNRSPEIRKEDPKPRLADLRESGSIEQDADLVVFLYRPELMTKDIEKKKSLKGQVNVIIAKNRNGQTLEFDMAFHAEFTKFTDVAAHETSPGGSGRDSG